MFIIIWLNMYRVKRKNESIVQKPAHSYLTKCIFVHAQGGWLYEEDR